MRFRAALIALALAAGALGAQTPAVIHLDDAGPGIGPRVLSEILTRPYDVVAPANSQYVLARGTSREKVLVVLGRNAVVEGTTDADVIVIAGDLYMHPGGRIGGRGMAYGGGVYESSLAAIHGGVTAWRDFTYDIEVAADGYHLRYRELNPTVTPTFALGGIYGVSIPSYDRANGLSLPVSVVVTPGDRLRIEPSLTYRSQLGRVDPWADVAYRSDSRTTVRLGAGRRTLTNDAWIRSDLINSLHYLALGNDTRNYYRAERAELSAERGWEGASGGITPYVGLRVERNEPVRPNALATGGPWAFRGRHDVDDVLRPNPQFAGRTMRSLLAGSTFGWTAGDVATSGRVDVEAANYDTGCAQCSAGPPPNFLQATLDGTIGFPTFGTQRLDFDLHLVASAGNTPPSRYAWLGGPGSLPTLELLELGGDELVFALGRYTVPLDRVQIPFVGAPTLSLREILGGAGLSGFPVIHQATGLRLSAGFVYGEVLVDPTRRRTRLGAGISTRR